MEPQPSDPADRAQQARGRSPPAVPVAACPSRRDLRPRAPVRHIRAGGEIVWASPAVSSHPPGCPHLGGSGAGRRARRGCAAAEEGRPCRLPGVFSHRGTASSSRTRGRPSRRPCRQRRSGRSTSAAPPLACAAGWSSPPSTTGTPRSCPRPSGRPRAARCTAPSCGAWSTRGTCQRGWPSTASG